MEKEAPGVLRVCRGAAALCPVHAVQGMVGAYFDTLMWLPVILIFSVPYTAPLVAMAGRGASLVLGGYSPVNTEALDVDAVPPVPPEA